MHKTGVVVVMALLLPTGWASAQQIDAPTVGRSFTTGGLDLSVGPSTGSSDDAPHLSVGSIGLDSRAGTTQRAAADGDSYRFVIPSEEPARKAPGFLVKFPLQP
jgi:hypothetical protein